MIPVKPNLTAGAEVTLSTQVPAEIYSVEDVPGVKFVVTRWELSYAERQAVARGQDIFLVQSTEGDSVSPAILLAGPELFEGAKVEEGPESVPTNDEGEEDPDRIKPREQEML